ncbi:hypothetical protein [Albimonas pacifica]|uniref:Uncharacterized protein n=1 Tax=Albimonas pacifica TaxID=1114924 RepID=A0A1I3HK15_9RHOB|nr:hypothetical protein [Albimonas pacifica]SFI36118.1 hypothetical protein SAMN05216258_10642 [Albimonas pacifica]
MTSPDLPAADGRADDGRATPLHGRKTRSDRTKPPRGACVPSGWWILPGAILGALLVGGLTTCARAQALTICGPRPALLATLAARGERPVFLGLSGEVVVEMLVAPGGGWTLITTAPEGMSCILAAGEAATPVGPRSAGSEREG